MSALARRALVALSAVVLALGLAGCDEESCTRPPANSLDALFIGFMCFGANFPGDPPQASLEIEPSTVDSGGTVRLDASGSSVEGRGTFEWDLDGRPGFELNSGGERVLTRVFTLGSAGELDLRELRLRVTDHQGRSSGTSAFLTIRAPTGLRAVLRVTPNPVPVNRAVLLDASASIGAIAFEWDLDGDGTFEVGPSTASVREVVYPTAGTRRATVRVTDVNGARATAGVDVVVTEARATVSARRTPFQVRLARVRMPDGLGTPRRRGSVATYRRVLVRGRFAAPRGGLGALRRFRRARWHARVDLSANLAKRTVRVRGHALVRFRKGRGRACVRITASSRPKGAPAGRLKLLGGRGDAARLRGGGRFRFRFEGATPSPEGRLRARLGRPRALPRACSRLSGGRP